MHTPTSPGLAFDAVPDLGRATLDQERELQLALEEEQRMFEQLQMMEAMQAEEEKLGELLAQMSLERSVVKPAFTEHCH